MDVLCYSFHTFFGEASCFPWYNIFQMCWNTTLREFHTFVDYYSVGEVVPSCIIQRDLVPQVGWNYHLVFRTSNFWVKAGTLRNSFLGFDINFIHSTSFFVYVCEAVSIPGSWYPDERFQRIYLVKRGMPQPKNYQAREMSRCRCWGLQGGKKIWKWCWLGHPGIASRMVLKVWKFEWICGRKVVPLLILTFTVLKSYTVAVNRYIFTSTT